MTSKKIMSFKVHTYYRGACAGSVMVPNGTKYLNMVTGWKIPIVKSKKFHVNTKPI